jgi:serine protease Do
MRFSVRSNPSLSLALAAFIALALCFTPPAAADQPPADEIANLAAVERAFQQVAEQVRPSVVGIRTQRRPGGTGDARLLEQPVLVNGTGTVVAADGLILTNEHVVQGATSIDVLLHDGRKLPATVFAADARSDLAVLHVARSGLTPVGFADYPGVARGQWCVVIGNPYGLGQDGQLSVSVGIIANLNRQLPGLGEVDDRFYSDMLQITAPISPGNSGGPLFNLRGELLGVVTAMHTRTPTDEGIGFAIPMSPSKRRVIDTLCRGEPVRHGYLGLTVRALLPAERDAVGAVRGVAVQQVEPGGPAAEAGLAPDDLIVAFEGQAIHGPAHLAELAGQAPIGSRVQLACLRGGAATEALVTIVPRDQSRVAWMRSGAVTWRGMRVTDLSEDARRKLCVDDDARGVVVIDVEEGTPASQAQLQVGDVIAQLGGQPVADTVAFMARVRDVSGTLEVVLRDGRARSISP